MSEHPENSAQQEEVDSENQDAKLLAQGKQESPKQQFLRQRKIAQECCDLGRKLLGEGDHQGATKEFSKAVMTFEFILKHNVQQKELKGEIADMHKNTILPAYSNLSLCYLRSKKYDMVITFANQVLLSDSANVKNLYRRGVARKFSKAFDQAIQDFQKVIKLDREMQQECIRLIAECKTLKIEQKKKQKELAKQFITGYSEDKPEPTPLSESVQNPQKESLWKRGLKCIRGLCPKLFKSK